VVGFLHYTAPPTLLSRIAKWAEPPAMPTARGLVRYPGETPTDINDARLGFSLSSRLWLSRKLEHRCLLTRNQACQKNTCAVGKFEGVVMYLGCRLKSRRLIPAPRSEGGIVKIGTSGFKERFRVRVSRRDRSPFWVRSVELVRLQHFRFALGLTQERTSLNHRPEPQASFALTATGQLCSNSELNRSFILFPSTSRPHESQLAPHPSEYVRRNPQSDPLRQGCKPRCGAGSPEIR
jgi:hypothetical protein